MCWNTRPRSSRSRGAGFGEVTVHPALQLRPNSKSMSSETATPEKWVTSISTVLSQVRDLAFSTSQLAKSKLPVPSTAPPSADMMTIPPVPSRHCPVRVAVM
jgi:hypothetical protein